MHVTKLVDFVAKIPEHFGLHFSDISMIFYAFLKFTGSNSRVHVHFSV